MSDKDEDKKNIPEESTDQVSENQSSVDQNNQPEGVEKQDNYSSQEITENINQNNQSNDEINQNNDQEDNQPQVFDTSNEKKEEELGTGHQVIHKKDGRLHIYVRQDKYKGELKSKNWVGRLYIDGKQKISSSGTTNLDEAVPILEKWFDDVQEESEKLKNQNKETQINENQNTSEENVSSTEDKQKFQDALRGLEKVQTPVNNTQNQIQEQTPPPTSNESTEPSKQDKLKSKLTNIFGKLKDIKLKKPSFANNLSKSSSRNSSRLPLRQWWGRE